MTEVPQILVLDEEGEGGIKLHESPNNSKSLSCDIFDSNTAHNVSLEEGGSTSESYDSDTSGIYFPSSEHKTGMNRSNELEVITSYKDSFDSEHFHRSPYLLRSSSSLSSSPEPSTSYDFQDSDQEKKNRRQTITPQEADQMFPKIVISKKTKQDRLHAFTQKYDKFVLPTFTESEEELDDDKKKSEGHGYHQKKSVSFNEIRPSKNNQTISETNQVKEKTTDINKDKTDPYVLNINVHLSKEFSDKEIPLKVNIIKEKRSLRKNVSDTFDSTDSTFESNSSLVSSYSNYERPSLSLSPDRYEITGEFRGNNYLNESMIRENPPTISNEMMEVERRENISIDPNDTTVESNTSTISYRDSYSSILNKTEENESANNAQIENKSTSFVPIATNNSERDYVFALNEIPSTSRNKCIDEMEKCAEITEQEDKTVRVTTCSSDPGNNISTCLGESIPGTSDGQTIQKKTNENTVKQRKKTVKKNNPNEKKKNESEEKIKKERANKKLGYQQKQNKEQEITVNSPQRKKDTKRKQKRYRKQHTKKTHHRCYSSSSDSSSECNICGGEVCDNSTSSSSSDEHYCHRRYRNRCCSSSSTSS